MNITVLYFGATADVVGSRRQDVEVIQGETAGHVFNSLLATYPHLVDHKLLFSVNQQFATGDEIVHDGDEIAIFTAVSGG